MHNARYPEYQLPPLLKKIADCHLFRVFVFRDATNSDLKKKAKEVAAWQKLEVLDLRFEEGFSEGKVSEIIDIFADAIGKGRDVTIRYEDGLPRKVMRTWYVCDQEESIRRGSVLN